MPKGDKWVVQSEQEVDDAYFGSQYDAEGYGRSVARENRSGFFLHGQDGTVRKQDHYGASGFFDGK